MNQTTNSLVMIKPKTFESYEDPTHSNNFWKQKSNENTLGKVLEEFEKVKDTLESHGIEVIVVNDTATPIKPASVFPDRISTHSDWSVILYPMLAPERQLEKHNPVLNVLQQQWEYYIKKVFDLSHHEKDSIALEWWWALLLDRVNKIVYVSLSLRANLKVLNEFCTKMWYTPITFTSYNTLAKDPTIPIYHTDILLSIGENFAVCCLDAIRDEDEKMTVKNSLEHTGHEIVDLTMDQMGNHFAGNMLTVKNKSWKHYTIMSQNAHNSLIEWQVQTLEKYVTIIPVAIPTIENIWWGSVRCMLLENFLTKK